MSQAGMSVEPPLTELHDPETGRLDASRIARYLGISLKDLACGLGAKYSTVHKTPSAKSLQPELGRVKRILEVLGSLLTSKEDVLAWLNSPHPDLDHETPLRLIVSGETEAVSTLLENAALGQPA